MFIKRILDGIARGLPGTDVQWEMASSDRMVRNLPRIRAADSTLGAVLVLLFPCRGSYHTVFIQRPEYNGVHSGQIGFPGGKMEKSDQSLTETALREACEETGICQDELTPIGKLTPLYIPVSNIEVTPVVGYIDHRPRFRLRKEEVVYTIEADLCSFLDRSIVREKPMEVRGELLNVKYYDYNSHVIWGATAMILHELLVIAEREGITFQV